MVRFSSVAMLALIASVLTGCGVPAEDGPADSFGLDFSMPPDSVPLLAHHSAGRVDGALLFMVDGIHAGVFEKMLAAGELPAIQKYFVDRGLLITRSVSTYPCITMSCLTSIVTGQFPGHHGLIAPKWFDRDRLVFRHYETLADKNKLDGDYASPTIYEQFPDRPTFSLFFQPHRGATKFFENTLSAGPAMAFSMYDLIDRIALYRLSEAMDIARQRKQFPAVTIIYLLSPNFYAYENGLYSEAYRAGLRHVDRQIGRVLGDIQRAGMLDRLVIALTADHGHCDTPRHVTSGDYLKTTLGLNVIHGTGNPDEDEPAWSRRAKYERVTGVTYGGGDRYQTLYLRKPLRKDGKVVGLAPWSERPSPEDLLAYPNDRGETINLPARLLEEEGIEAVAYRAGPEAVRVGFRTGEVEFRRVGVERLISYKLISGSHPPEWQGKVPDDVLAGKPLTGRQWLDATIGTDLPDLPEQILAHFDGKLAGDLDVLPALPWDIDGWRKAGHGGLRATEMLTISTIAGPGVPKGRLPAGRIIDLMPTILEALGRPIPPGLDGQSLIRREQPATTRPADGL